MITLNKVGANSLVQNKRYDISYWKSTVENKFEKYIFLSIFMNEVSKQAWGSIRSIRSTIGALIVLAVKEKKRDKSRGQDKRRGWVFQSLTQNSSMDSAISRCDPVTVWYLPGTSQPVSSYSYYQLKQ